MSKCLKQSCRFVKGARNAAIYDLASEKVYAVNDVGKNHIETFLADQGRLCANGAGYIDKLEEMGLIENGDYGGSIDDGQPPRPECFLHYAWLELTEQCNLRCVHCYGQFGLPASSPEGGGAISGDEWKKIIREIKEAGCNAIQLIGGEPLLFPHYRELLTFANHIGIDRMDVFTNGTLIDEGFVELAKETKINARVSLYGHNAQVHDSVTGTAGSFQKTEAGLKLLNKHGIPTRIAVVLMDMNQCYIEEIKKYIVSLGHEYTGYDTIRQVAGKVDNCNCITDVNLLKSRYQTSADFSVSGKQYAFNRHFNNCWGGKMAIAANGDVMPCIFSRNAIVGNIMKDTFAGILDNISACWSLTLDQVDVCKDCEYRYACHNCRPLALSLSGSINAKEPRCCYDPYDGIWRDIRECTKELAEWTE